MDEARDSAVMTEQIQENAEISAAVVKEKTSSDNSEYDSVDSYSEDEEQVVKARSKASGLDSHSGSEGSVILEREEGDGQESAPQKKVDDDEDKKNPQYIPKRGTFYEHDDRTAEDNIESQEVTEAEKTDKDGNKKKVWQDKKEKWSHDRFNDQEQAPKSRAELVAIYGYDIRNEDGPPRARRRRRYGRGPNKYTRNWEDEDAYSKPPVTRPQRIVKKQTKPGKTRNSEEFPPLSGSTNDRSRTKSRSSESNNEESYSEEKEVPNRRSQERQPVRKNNYEEKIYNHQQQPKPANKNSQRPMPNNDRDDQINQSNENKLGQVNRIGSGRVVKPKGEIKDSDYRGFTTKTRQYRPVRSEPQKVFPQRPAKKDSEFIQSQNFTNKHNSQLAEMEKEISQLNIQDGVYKGGKQGNSSNNNNSNQNRQGSVPPRLQNSEQKGSKRYSSMRQRSLPETGTPPAANFSFYPSAFLLDYNSTAPPPATQQPILPAQIAPTALVTPQVPVTAAPPPILQAPFPPAAPFGPQGPPPQAYLQAAPPPFIAAPPAQPQIVSFVSQAQPAFVQGFQGQFNAVTQPADLYQPQVGITYYSADQQVVQRAAPQKRPKAAIPIVAPTDFKENKEQERTPNNQNEETSASEAQAAQE